MILYPEHFQEKLDTISNYLLIEGSQPKTIYVKRGTSDDSMSREGLEQWYKACFKSFPLDKTYISEEVSIDSSFRHYFLQYHKNEDFREEPGRGSIVTEGVERDALLISLEEYIREWTDNIVYDFAEIMANVKAGHVFVCIDDDLIILKNLLKFYRDIRQSQEQQLHFFHRISIPKPISDLMTDILIELIADKVGMLSPDILPQETQAIIQTLPTFKINWLASQQEFAELVHELTNKGYWSLPDGGIASHAQNLSKMFDFSASKRKADSNIAANLLSYLSPIHDKKTKETTYAYIKPGKERRFACIPYLKKGGGDCNNLE